MNDEAIGLMFEVRCCPECGVMHLGPEIPWHAYDCSEPDLTRYVAQIQGPAAGAEESA